MIVSDSVKLTNDSVKSDVKEQEAFEQEPLEPEQAEQGPSEQGPAEQGPAIITDEADEDSDEDSDEDEDSDSDDEYERIDMMGGASKVNIQSGGGQNEDESMYPNSRYYIKRLKVKILD